MPARNPRLALYTDKLRVRVCGICLEKDRILLVRHGQTLQNKAFWAPPGGGLHYGETLRACLQREWKEETGLQVEVGRFLFLNEFLQPPLHAVELFFEVRPTGGTLLTGTDPEAAPDAQLIEQVQWLTLQELQAIPPAEKHRVLVPLRYLQDLLEPAHYFLG